MKQYECVQVGRARVDLLKEVCQARGENLSSFIRRAIRTELAKLSFLTDAEKKALGLTIQSQKR